MKNESSSQLWASFIERHALTAEQTEQFQLYYRMLVETNDIHNLTAITDLKRVLSDHFDDSLALEQFIDCRQVRSLCDVGTGAGFPALPLKIKYPHLALVLVEVNHKKIQFLYDVIQKLGLQNIEIYGLDWRTFLRKTAYDLSIFCARASLQPAELIRMFKPSSPYSDRVLVYWASQAWVPDVKEAPLVEKEEWYTLGNKKRKLVFFRKSPVVAPSELRLVRSVKGLYN